MRTISFATLFMLTVPCSGFALDVKYNAGVKLAEEYSSNLFLTTLPHTAVFGQGGDITLGSIIKSGGFESMLNANFNNRAYIGGQHLDYTNQLFNMKNSYAFSRQLKVGFNAEYNLDTSSSAMDDPDDSVGLVFFRIPKVSRMIQPHLTYAVTEDTTVKIAHKYRETEYDRILELTAAPFPNTTGHTTTADITHRVSRELQLTASYFHKDFSLVHLGETVMPSAGSALQTSPTWDKTISTELATIGGSYDFSDTLKLGISGGIQSNAELSQAYDVSSNGAVVRHVAAVKDNTFTEVHQVKLNKSIIHADKSRSDMALEHSRTVVPSPAGVLVQFDKYSATLSHAFSPVVAGRLGFSYSDRSYPAIDKKNAAVLGVQAYLGWKFMPNFELAGNYQYLQLQDDSLAAAHQLDLATSQAMFVTVNYTIDGQEKF